MLDEKGMHGLWHQAGADWNPSSGADYSPGLGQNSSLSGPQVLTL